MNFVLIALFLLSSQLIRGEEPRNINIQNDSGSKIEIYWINPYNNEATLQSTPVVYPGSTFSLNSFRTHFFEVREVPGKGGKCFGQNDTCRVGHFTVNENDEQTVFINKDWEFKHQDNKSIARETAGELMVECEEKVLTSVKEKSLSATEAVLEMKKCVEDNVAYQMEMVNEEISVQAGIRKGLALAWENYTCADFDLKTTTPMREDVWYNEDEDIERDVQIMLDRPASEIHLIKDFISSEECQAMEDAARPKLHTATVADGKGGSEISPNRKAMQANIRIPWHREEEGHPLTTLSRRVYDYVNYVLDLDIEEDGQEDLMSIQYFGRGEDDSTPDQYIPHCDGDCNGMEFRPGNRMATVVVYCTVPKKGGATNFRNANVHVVPEVGSATFFSYVDPVTMKMDNGFTEHSGCPVVEGEKKIVTQWVRYGVDKEHPWDSFNTLGIPLDEMAKLEEM
jgi:hypothetical protein